MQTGMVTSTGRTANLPPSLGSEDLVSELQELPVLFDKLTALEECSVASGFEPSFVPNPGGRRGSRRKG